MLLWQGEGQQRTLGRERGGCCLRCCAVSQHTSPSIAQQKQQRLPFPPDTSPRAVKLGNWCELRASAGLRFAVPARVPWPASAPLSDFRTLRAADGARRTCAVRSQCLTCAGRKARSPCRSAASTARGNLLPCGHVGRSVQKRFLCGEETRHPGNHLRRLRGAGMRQQSAAERSRAQQSATLQASTTFATAAVAAAVAVQCAPRGPPAMSGDGTMVRCETHCCTRCAALRCTRRRQASP